MGFLACPGLGAAGPGFPGLGWAFLAESSWAQAVTAGLGWGFLGGLQWAWAVPAVSLEMLWGVL